ncbi:MAG: glycosyltransferase [Rhizobiaceae bacterium]|nr:glycosyltransferase [Rhizobiaceae bacterium]
MAQLALRLSAFYAAHPAVLWRHGRRAARSLAEGGLPLLVARGRAVAHGMRSAASPVFARAVGVTGRRRGTILIVTHDAELGGAQHVARTFAAWLKAATLYDVRIVMMRGGAFAYLLGRIAPTCNIESMLETMPRAEVEATLREWAGDDVRAIFLNSTASGGFLDFWKERTPTIAFIHELPKILKLFPSEFALIKERADLIVGGSEPVSQALEGKAGVDPARLRVVTGFVEAEETRKGFTFDDKRAAKRALGYRQDEFVVAACGVVHWRKGPQAFVEVAARALEAIGRPARFVWIGGGPDQAHCEKLAAASGLGDRLRFTGLENDVERHIAAADLFLLPSEEDPFPLVCLYAARLLAPVVCFEEAGGMPGFVARGCGLAVPFGDVDAMARAVIDYAGDDPLRRRQGETGRALVEAEYTVAFTGPRLLHHIREAAGLAPGLSVIVPSYNCAPWLEERLDSIWNQTFQDFEVILLDDRSTDGSLEILEHRAATRPDVRLLVNDVNSGSPFPQWLKGMALARAEAIWIAEADDACEPGFAAALLPELDDRNVFLAHARSVPVNDKGEVLGDYGPIYLDRIAEGRWSRAHRATDHEEANQGLGIANSIPNASGVIFRRFEPEAGFSETLRSMRLCGDWFFYLRAMRGGMVAYDARALNRHRRHDQTVTQRTEGSPVYFSEFETVRRFISSTWRQSSAARNAIRRFATEDLDRFAITDPEARERVLAASPPPGEKAMPSIMVAVSDLSPGGGQMFGVRLANAWAAAGGRVVLFNVRHFPDHPRVVAKIDPRVAVVHAGDPSMGFEDVLVRFDIDVVHSSIWWADRFVHEHAEALGGRPWIVTMHGCYETHLDHPAVDITFPGRIGPMLERVDLWVPTAEKNRRVFAVHGAPRAEARIRNGVAAEPSKPLSRPALGLRDDALVMCLASRAIAEKGWREAVELTSRLNAAGLPVDLMLIGEGPETDAVAAGAPAHVRLCGQVDNLQDHLEAADIAILPSTFVGESMPLVLIEAMARSRPVVATDVGEIPAMIGDGENAAGAVVPLIDGRVDIEGFAAAIRRLADPEHRHAAGLAARARYEADYTVEAMIEAYGREYRRLIEARDQAA